MNSFLLCEILYHALVLIGKMSERERGRETGRESEGERERI